MSGWSISTLGEVIEPISTIDPRREPDNEFSYVDVSSVSNQTFRIEETQRLLGRDAPSRARRQIKQGDILFATIRPTLKRIARVLPEYDGDVCSTGYFVFRTKPFLDPNFLFYFLMTPKFIDEMESIQTGASYPAVNDTQVRSQSISFPPIDEQKRIVAVLDEAFEGIAKAIANAERNLANARELFNSSVDLTISKYGSDWLEGSLEELIGPVSTGPFGTLLHKSDYVTGGTPIINPAHIVDGEIVHDPNKTVAEEAVRRLKSYLLKNGDIVIGRRGEMGRCAVVTDKHSEWLCGTGSFFIRVNNRTSSVFSTHLLRSGIYRRKLEERAGGATMLNLSNRALASMKVALPALAEQHKMLSLWDHLKGSVKAAEDLYREKLCSIEELKQSILHRAFSGALAYANGPRPVAKMGALEATVSPAYTADVLAFAYSKHRAAQRDRTFGRVKGQKILHLVEAVAGVDLGREPIKDAAGPNDSAHMRRAEEWAAQLGYFAFEARGTGGYDFRPGQSFEKTLASAYARLSSNKEAIAKVIDLLVPLDSQEAEVVATVHAAWNNLIVDGIEPTRDAVVAEARENWTPSKLEIPISKFENAVRFIRRNDIVPDGSAKPVRKRQESLF